MHTKWDISIFRDPSKLMKRTSEVRRLISTKLNAGRGTVDKTAVVGIKDRETNQIKAKVVSDTTVYTDDHASY